MWSAATPLKCGTNAFLHATEPHGCANQERVAQHIDDGSPKAQRQKDRGNSHSGSHICYELPCKRAQDDAQLRFGEPLGVHYIRWARSRVKVSFEGTFERQRFLDFSFSCTFSCKSDAEPDLGVEMIFLNT
jgi:hypothetical protein